MSVPDERSIFMSRCLRVGAAATAAGATLRKAAGKTPALEVSAGGKSVVFPIVTDDVLWRETTVEEALYVVLLDARGWSGAKVDTASVASLDVEAQQQVPRIARGLVVESDRIKLLADVLGGHDRLQALYVAAEL